MKQTIEDKLSWQTLSGIGVVMEGGGMRGLYTCGVLEWFMEQDIKVPYMIGVSAGACNGLSYASWQPGRNERVILGFIKDHRYMGFRNLLKTGNYFGMDFIFDTIPNRHIAFDFESLMLADHNFKVGTTDINTGEAVYFEKKDIDPHCQVVRASAALPLLSQTVQFAGRELLDGGIVDAVPVKKAFEDGCEKVIVILTRHYGYVKKPSKGIKIISKVYRKYPKLIEAMEKRHLVYNETLSLIEHLKEEGKVFVIQPRRPLVVGRLERDTVKLKALHDLGYQDAKACHNELMVFLAK